MFWREPRIPLVDLPERAEGTNDVAVGVGGKDIGLCLLKGGG